MDKKLLVGLEVGTTKIVILVSELLADGMLNVIGIGRSPSYGIDKGSISDLSLLEECIKRAVDQAELMADCNISSVYLSFSSECVVSQNEVGMVPILDKEVTSLDIDNVIYAAKSVKITDEHHILHVIPQEYSVDDQRGIKNPIGLSGIRIQIKVHLITCHNNFINNLVKAVERCGIHVDQLIFNALASGYAVLTENERDLGVCVVDIGGGTMDIAIYISGSLYHTKVIPYAGNIVTSDISYVFGLSFMDAEDIKLKYGCFMNSEIDKSENIEIPSLGDRFSRILHRDILAEVIELRYVELFNLVKYEIYNFQNIFYKNNVKNNLIAGIVLTGGAVQIDGIINCAKRVFNNYVRIGYPSRVTGLTDLILKPYYSTAVGLLHYGTDINFKYLIDSKNKRKRIIYFWLKKFFRWLNS